MASPRISQALDRIDTALAQIETQAALSRLSPPAGDAADHQHLVTRHEALRASVTASLADLESLIEGLDR